MKETYTSTLVVEKRGRKHTKRAKKLISLAKKGCDNSHLCKADLNTKINIYKRHVFLKETMESLAKEYNVSRPTISRWIKEIKNKPELIKNTGNIIY